MNTQFTLCVLYHWRYTVAIVLLQLFSLNNILKNLRIDTDQHKNWSEVCLILYTMIKFAVYKLFILLTFQILLMLFFVYNVI